MAKELELGRRPATMAVEKGKVHIRSAWTSASNRFQLAKAAGAKTIIGITRSAWKREVAENLGADITLAPDENTKNLVLDATDGLGADLVVESAGKLSVLAQAMDLVRLGGRVLGYGIHTNTEGSLPFYDMYFKEIQFINARAATDKDFVSCLELVGSGAVDLKTLIRDDLPLEKLGKAIGSFPGVDCCLLYTSPSPRD